MYVTKGNGSVNDSYIRPVLDEFHMKRLGISTDKYEVCEDVE